MVITTTDSSVKIEDNSGVVWTGGLNTFVLTYSAPEDSVTLFDDTRLIATGKLTDSTINGTQLTGDNIDSALQDIFSASASGGPGSGAVSSVNGYTGDVALTAGDVNAYTQDQVDTMLGQVNTAEFAGPYATIDVIPTPYDTNDLYLVGDAVPYAIYASVAGVLTQIGSSSVDLSDYYTKDEIDSIGESDPIFNAWKNGTSVVVGSSATGTGIAIGNVAQGAGIAIGKTSVSSNTNSISIGNNTFSTGTGIAIGYMANGNVNYGVAIGTSSVASTNGIAIGYKATTTGANGIAIGYNTVNTASNGTVLGFGAKCNSSINGTALGTQAVVNNEYEIGIGANNKSLTGGTTDTNTQFSVASFSANSSNKKNTLEIRQNDDIYIWKNGSQIKLQDNLGGGSAPQLLDVTDTLIRLSADGNLIYKWSFGENVPTTSFTMEEDVDSAALDTTNSATIILVNPTSGTVTITLPANLVYNSAATYYINGSVGMTAGAETGVTSFTMKAKEMKIINIYGFGLQRIMEIDY